MQDIMTVEEAAEYLRLRPDTIRKKARRGDLPCAKVGKEWRFEREQLRTWIRQGGDRYEALVDEGLALAVAEAQADPENQKGKPLAQFMRERGL